MSRTPPGPRKVLRWLKRRVLPTPPPVRTPAMLAADRIAEADLARDRRDWPAAAEHYRAALDLRPDDVSVRVQLGHMLKEAGRLDEAEAAYAAAALAAPLDAEPWLQRAHVLKALDRREAAIDAFVQALVRDPDALGARDELIAAGARTRLPRSTYGSERAAADLARIGQSLGDGLKALGSLVQVSTYPLDAWDGFRRAHPVSPPPAGPSGDTLVVIEGLGAAPWAVACTLDSLSDQRNADWTAVVRCDPATLAHPVAGRTALDPRIVFVGPDPAALETALAARPGASLLALPAGVVLDPTALDWFCWAVRRTGAAAVYADHDHHEEHWRLGPVHARPALQAMPDADDLAAHPHPPAAVMLAADQAPALLAVLADGIEPQGLGRALIQAVIPQSQVAHLPRLLSSVRMGSPADAPAARTPRTDVMADAAERMLVVMPTRDQADLLDTAVHSLRALADRPDRIDILVVDNRSADAATHRRLAELAEARTLAVMTNDEPFNWARINNLAVREGSQPLLVFANNDIEAIARGWDTTLRRTLARPDVGVVGARLLYGDRTLQHAGIVLGAGDGRPTHEGVGAGPLEDGPAGRYRRSRPVAAVTGAFMAVRRDTFATLGGFDERLAIGYNDIDLCLSARAAALKVIYAADLTLIHHESKTRGLNDSVDKIAWDDAELKRLHDVWGDALFLDPGVNPHWGSTGGRPMDGYRDPTLSQILTWLDHSARVRPWAVTPVRQP